MDDAILESNVVTGRLLYSLEIMELVLILDESNDADWVKMELESTVLVETSEDPLDVAKLAMLLATDRYAEVLSEADDDSNA